MALLYLYRMDDLMNFVNKAEFVGVFFYEAHPSKGGSLTQIANPSVHTFRSFFVNYIFTRIEIP